MSTRTLRVLLVAVALPSAVAAQDDPDQAVAGGTIPTGWSVRLDRADAKMENVRIVKMGDGLHATLGPAVILYRTKDQAKGQYRIAASFTQTRAARHPEGYGLFIGASDLSGAAQRYTYFLVRQDGKFLVKRRDGDSTSVVVPWTEHAAVRNPAGERGATNELAIEVGREQVAFLVNGEGVATVERSAVDVGGICGYRVNHNLDVHLSPMKVTKRGAGG